MNAVRWQRIKEIFEAAQALAPAARTAFLDTACAGDEALRVEVQSLLAAHDAPGPVDRLSEGLVSPLLARFRELPAAGRRVGPYELVEELGRGGMGVVYKARDVRLDRFVALKFLPLHHGENETAKARFLAEAKAASSLDHTNICTIHHIGETEDGQLFIAMSYYAGQSLKEKLAQEGPLPVETCVDVAMQVAAGLACAHEAGMLHRDVKPANLMMTGRGRVKIVDFGIAKLDGSDGLTKVGTRLGTVAYMAPEQVRGDAVDHRADLWALGVVLYEMLTGQRPFSGDDITATMYAILEREPVPVGRLRPGVPPALERVVQKALTKDPAHRYASATAFMEALQQALEGKDVPEAPVLTGTVTFFFSDIEGSTRLLQRLGDRYPGVLAEQRHLVREAFRTWGGRELDTAGDGFFAAFSRARDAVAAAAAVQRAVALHPWPEGAAVRLRIGLHTGEPLFVDGEYAGIDVHRAARICSAAHGGQVLLSQVTAELVERDMPEELGLVALGAHRLKDIEAPEHLYQLTVPGVPAQFPPPKSLGQHPTNVPVPPTPLVGRAREQEAALRLLSEDAVRLVTLTGPGGTGKTRLALQVAGDAAAGFEDGVTFVSLAALSDPELVPSSIAQMLGVAENAGQPVDARVRDHLKNKHVLLVLDNFEQVVPAAPFVGVLLAECPSLKVLVTSRVALRLQVEHEFPVPPLALPDLNHVTDAQALARVPAVELFAERARAVRPSFTIDEGNARVVAELCIRLDGLPLAIELAAARIKLFSPQAMLARLGRLDLLTGGARDLPARHQTLRHAIAWSYDLLSEAERKFFRLMSVFVGGCTLEAAEWVCASRCAADFDVIDGIAALVDHSLLRQEESVRGDPRFAMLETIRAYGLERLEAAGDMEAVRNAHADYFVALAERAEPELTRADQAAWLDRLEVEHANLRAALVWAAERGDAETGLRLGAALWRFWLTRGYMKEGRQWLERLLAMPRAPTAVRARVLNGLGTLAHNQGDNERARAVLEESLALFREVDDERGMAAVLNNLAWVACEQSDFGTAQSLSVESLTLNRVLGERRGTALALNNLGWVANYQGEYAVARAYHQQSLALRQEIGDKRGVAFALCSLGWAEQYHGAYARSADLLDEALGIVRAINDRVLISWALTRKARLAQDQGAYDQAVALLEESVSMWREGGNLSLVAWSATELGSLAVYRGDLGQASILLEEGLSVWEDIGSRWGVALALQGTARLAQAGGDVSRATDLFRKCLAIYCQLAVKLDAAQCLEGLAAISHERQASARAARLWAAAAALRETIEAPVPAHRRDPSAALVGAMRTALGEAAFNAAWAEGEQMDLEQAVAFALMKFDLQVGQ